MEPDDDDAPTWMVDWDALRVIRPTRWQRIRSWARRRLGWERPICGPARLKDLEDRANDRR